MTDFLKHIQDAVNILRAGGMVVLIDDEDRENEGDLIAAAELTTPQSINFMATEGRGLICLAMSEEQINKLQLPMMNRCSHSPFDTSFTVSIEASNGISTGISAKDRAHTIRTAIHINAKPEDIVYPGHIFPLKANPEGVIKRRGHTEGSVDLMKIAGLNPSAVICEIMNPDGSMSRRKELIAFAQKHNFPVLSIQDIVNYRIQTEVLVSEEIATRIPLANYGEFKMILFKNSFDKYEHFALYKPMQKAGSVPLVRVHSECITGDLLGSLKCDCGPQLDNALDLISKEGGLLIYLRQEGRGIGLINKLKAYVLQDQGLDTVDANLSLGLPVDKRDYSIAYQILKYLNMPKIRLITNNPQKMDMLRFFGIEIEERIASVIPVNPENEKYIEVKKQKLGHLFCQKNKKSD
jgi:3,4-dihydroxy 2-butanone 4-phosphate synthase/GTP cyclohydrolase II